MIIFSEGGQVVKVPEFKMGLKSYHEDDPRFQLGAPVDYDQIANTPCALAERERMIQEFDRMDYHNRRAVADLFRRPSEDRILHPLK